MSFRLLIFPLSFDPLDFWFIFRIFRILVLRAIPK
uniref:Uncharacterized protein n=1 Tax=Arundo donax TaxID=35708 RepID=A0A0A9EA73_ARUDO